MHHAHLRTMLSAMLGAAIVTPVFAGSIDLQGVAVVYSYAPARPFSLTLRSLQASVQINDVAVNEGFRVQAGCKGAILKKNQSCNLSIQAVNAVQAPDALQLSITVDGEPIAAKLPVYQVDEPLSFWSSEQESPQQRIKKNPSELYLPSTKLGQAGDTIDLHLRSQHHDRLKLSQVQAPSYLSVHNNCDLTSPLQPEATEVSNHCVLEVSYNPTRPQDRDGELVLTFKDAERTYPLAFQIKAQPWQALQARKIAVAENARFVLLLDRTLWTEALQGAWGLVAEEVDDFEVGPDGGLMVRSGSTWRVACAGYKTRYGIVDEDACQNNWATLSGDVQRAFVAQRSTFYWDAAGHVREAGFRDIYWDGRGRYPNDDATPRPMAKDFVRINQDSDAVHGIDAQGNVWMRGTVLEQHNDGVLYNVNAADWMLREQHVAQYEACGTEEVKLNTDGALYARGFNYLGKLGAGKQINLKRWTLVNTDVRAFAMNCERLATTHSHTGLYALKRDGVLWGVGENSRGQLGTYKDGIDQSLTWKPILGDVASFSASRYFVLMLKVDGTVWASGAHRADVTKRVYSSALGQVAPLGVFWR